MNQHPITQVQDILDAFEYEMLFGHGMLVPSEKLFRGWLNPSPIDISDKLLHLGLKDPGPSWFVRAEQTGLTLFLF